jgi:hypothetical protein
MILIHCLIYRLRDCIFNIDSDDDIYLKHAFFFHRFAGLGILSLLKERFDFDFWKIICNFFAQV